MKRKRLVIALLALALTGLLLTAALSSGEPEPSEEPMPEPSVTAAAEEPATGEPAETPEPIEAPGGEPAGESIEEAAADGAAQPPQMELWDVLAVVFDTPFAPEHEAIRAAAETVAGYSAERTELYVFMAVKPRAGEPELLSLPPMDPPADGIELTLVPAPEDAARRNYLVLQYAPEGEPVRLTPERTEAGLRVTLPDLTPFVLCWTDPEPAPTPTPTPTPARPDPGEAARILRAVVSASGEEGYAAADAARLLRD